MLADFLWNRKQSDKAETALAKGDEDDSGLPASLKLRLALPVPAPRKLVIPNVVIGGLGLTAGFLIGWHVTAVAVFLSIAFTSCIGGAYFFAYLQRKAELIAKVKRLGATQLTAPSQLQQLAAEEAVLDRLIYEDDEIDERGKKLWGHLPRALPPPDKPPGVVICRCAQTGCPQSEHRWTSTPDAEDHCSACHKKLRHVRGPVECPSCELTVWARAWPNFTAFSCPRCAGPLHIDPSEPPDSVGKPEVGDAIAAVASSDA